MHLASLPAKSGSVGPTIAQLQALAERMTYHRAKAEAMGFQFSRITVGPFPRLDDGSIRLRCTFTCVCGRREEFTSTFPSFIGGAMLQQRMDVARELWQHGSFSRDHLIADGYTEEQVAEIEAKGKAFDDECVRFIAPLQDRAYERRLQEQIWRNR